MNHKIEVTQLPRVTLWVSGKLGFPENKTMFNRM